MNGNNKEPEVKTLSKLTIASLDKTNVQVVAQYNPRELQISRTIAWGKHANVGSGKGQQMEFTGQEGRTTTIELLFDASESGEIMSQLSALETLAVSEEPSGNEAKKRRPHHCALVWGTFQTMRDNVSAASFPCVILELSIKYTMFSPSGTPIRATASVKLQEAQSVSIKADAPAVPPPSAGQPAGAPAATPNTRPNGR